MNQGEQNRRTADERSTNRYMLMFYDCLALLLIWSIVFLTYFAKRRPYTTPKLAGNLLAAFLCFWGFRLMLKVYRQIIRTGNIRAFARELTAGVCGSFVYVILCRLLKLADAPLTAPIIFAAIYVVACMVARLLYYHLYQIIRRSDGDDPAIDALKKLISTLTLADLDSPDEGALLRIVLEPEKRETSPINEIQNVVDQFAIRGNTKAITQITKGYINRTYRIDTLSDKGHVHKYILQRINTNVFPDVDALMENFKFTTDHLHGRFFLPATTKKGAVQMLRPTKDGRAYLRDDSGCWRMLTYIDDVYSLDIPDKPETFYYAGRAFGKFIKEMADVKTEDIKVVIPDFHNTYKRYEALEKVIEKDPKGRAKDVQKEIAFVRARAGNYGIIAEALDSGRIPTRICHNDCNLNNILFDNKTHMPVAIIDLDTVMPSSPLYDYGDSMRIGTNTATDDEKDLSKVSCDLDLYARYARGYLEECGSLLTKEELELLPVASLVITSEDGIRFLMDHIDGDTYYNIFYPGQNLDRSRTQLTLLADMERKLPQIVEILQKLYREFGLETTLDPGKVKKLWKTAED